ncbi:DUF3866 family protein [Paenibacillus sp. HJGM_3]|uniref:DUF3866 family protein n=1 Tax=Paenibacillus sp. HJGM_3 TaxID=3379816 RepID=UPI00385C0628
MTIMWAIGTVVTVEENHPGVQELQVQMSNGNLEGAVHFPGETGMIRVRAGVRVVLNVTAERLKLGSGGMHFVHHVLEHKGMVELDTIPQAEGHIMKLRYTPQQRAVLAVEEAASPHHELFRGRPQLDGLPVLIGELHSMLPIACAWLMAERGTGVGVGGLRLSYVMTDGGALPLAYSRHAAALTACGWLAGTVTYGHAYGGTHEAVNKFTALLTARHVHRADIAIATMGPGIVGTGTRLGHTATETAELVHATLALGGRAIVVPRLGFADARERHRGLCAHTLAALGDLCLAPATLPLPAELPPEARACIHRQIAEADLASMHYIPVVPGMDPVAIAQRMAAYPLPITTMGRRFEDDPAYWAGVCAAAEYARLLLETEQALNLAPDGKEGGTSYTGA